MANKASHSIELLSLLLLLLTFVWQKTQRNAKIHGIVSVCQAKSQKMLRVACKCESELKYKCEGRDKNRKRDRDTDRDTDEETVAIYSYSTDTGRWRAHLSRQMQWTVKLNYNNAKQKKIKKNAKCILQRRSLKQLKTIHTISYCMWGFNVKMWVHGVYVIFIKWRLPWPQEGERERERKCGRAADWWIEWMNWISESVREWVSGGGSVRCSWEGAGQLGERGQLQMSKTWVSLTSLQHDAGDDVGDDAGNDDVDDNDDDDDHHHYVLPPGRPSVVSSSRVAVVVVVPVICLPVWQTSCRGNNNSNNNNAHRQLVARSFVQPSPNLSLFALLTRCSFVCCCCCCCNLLHSLN